MYLFNHRILIWTGFHFSLKTKSYITSNCVFSAFFLYFCSIRLCICAFIYLFDLISLPYRVADCHKCTSNHHPTQKTLILLHFLLNFVVLIAFWSCLSFYLIWKSFEINVICQLEANCCKSVQKMSFFRLRIILEVFFFSFKG